MVTTKEKPQEMLYSYLKIIFDPAGVMGAAGTVILGVFAFLSDIPTEYPGIAGALLLLASVYQKIMQTRRDNQRAKIEEHNASERKRVLALYEAGQMTEEMATFILGHLDIDEPIKKG